MPFANNVSSMSDCERNALLVFGSSTAILLTGALLIVLARFVWRHRLQVDSDEDSLHELIRSRQMGWLPKQAERILLGKPMFGKLLILTRSILYTICGIIYVSNTYRYDRYLCLITTMRPQYVIELISNLFFLFIFMLKITASKNVLKTWFSVDCLIDYYTILPIILAPVLGRYHYNFGFLYFTKITKIIDAVVLLNLVDQERSIRKLKLISQLIAAWFTFAGIILLLERLGDFWEHREILRELEFLDCIYFLLVTVATVGYGDIVCTSYLGRLVNIFIIVSALISITTHMSELYELFRFSKQYSGTFNNEYHPRHVVVCGEINYDSVSIFLDAFIHADRGRYDKNIMVVFLSEQDPDHRLKALLKRESMNATFLKGSATSHKDLHRVKVRAAESVIILANTNSADPAKGDWENIMRVVSIKQMDPKCRIICVLALFENKALMSNIPGWNEGRTDQFDRAICVSQLKMGMMSQNCISPGISTFLSNLLVRVSVPATVRLNRKLPQWVNNYFEGTKYSLFSVKLSPSFDGMQFRQVVLISMRELRVIPLAVQLIFCSDSTEQIIINPGTRLRMKSQQMRAIVLAASFIDAQRLRVFCVNCLQERGSLTADVIHTCRHRALSQVDTTLEKPSEKMNHQPSSQTQGAHRIRFHLTHWARPFLVHKKSRHIAPIRVRNNNDLVIRRSRRRSKHIEQPHPTGGVDIMRDSTGLFYWVADRPFQVACLSLREMMQCTFCDHILVCLTKQQGTSKLGLASFVMPLRSTRIPMQDLKPIVFLGDQTLVEQEWCSLRNFPQVYILSGSPLSRAYLRAAGVETCSTCVVLSCADGFHGGQTLMADKESILCTLNIRRMLAECTEQDPASATDQQPMIVTELSDIQSSYLLSVTNDYRTRNGMACFSPFYAAGSMFASTTLTSLASNVFFDPTVLAFIETVLLGGPSHEVEKVFAEDSGFFPGLRGHAITSIPFPEFEFQRDREQVVGRKYSQKQDQKAGQKQRKPSPDGSLFRVPDMNEDSMLIVESVPVSQDQSSLNSVQKLTSSSPDLHERGDSTITMDKAVRSAIQVKPETPVPFMRFISLNDDSTNSAEWPSTSVNFTGLRRQLTDTHVNGDNHVQMGRLRYSNVRNWRPLSTNSFLSYTTESGSVKVHLSRARLLPLSALGAQLNQLIHQVNVELTFDQMFYTVLQETGTICVGLYRRVARLAEDEDQSKPNTEESFRDLGAQIPRFVCTFPDSNTPIFPDDQVYCFTAVMENPDAEW